MAGVSALVARMASRGMIWFFFLSLVALGVEGFDGRNSGLRSKLLGNEAPHVANEYVCIHDEFEADIRAEHEKFAPKRLSSAMNVNAMPVGSYAKIRLEMRFDYLLDGVDPNTCYEGVSSVTFSSTTYDCNEHRFSQARFDYLTGKLIPLAEERLEKVLRVIPEAITITSGTCGSGGGGVSIDVDYSPTADMVMYFTARPTTTGVLAYASPCRYSSSIGRPIAGHVNFGPGELEPEMLYIQVYTAVHEMIHALGFTHSLLDNWVDDTGTLIPLATTLYSGTDPTNIGQEFLKSPKVLEFARNHFACSTLAGVPLENGGGGGTSGSHWEKRVFVNEIMSGSLSYSATFSGMTLAFLEDSGWYEANFSAAEPLWWGRGLGCPFVESKCNVAVWEESNHFCDEVLESSCTKNLRAKGLCNLREYQSVVPTEYQYVSDDHMKGMDDLADYCPYYASATNGGCRDMSLETDQTKERGEAFGDNSRCLMSKLTSNELFAVIRLPNLPACHPTICRSTTDARVKVDDVWYLCSSKDDQIRVDFYYDYAECPDVEFLCEGVAPPEGTWPAITLINPDRSKANGGEVITITGTDFPSNVSVKIAGYDCTDLIRYSSTFIQCRVGDARGKIFFTTDVHIVVYDLNTGYTGVSGFQYERNLFDILADIPYVGFIFEWLRDKPEVMVPILVLLVGSVLCCLCLCQLCLVCGRARKRYRKPKKLTKKRVKKMEKKLRKERLKVMRVHPKDALLDDPEAHYYHVQEQDQAQEMGKLGKKVKGGRKKKAATPNDGIEMQKLMF